MMTDRQIGIEVTVDATGARTGINQIRQEANNLARDVTQASERSGRSLENLGGGAPAAARNVDSATRSIVASVQRATAAMESGGRQSSAYFEVLARQRGVDGSTIQPYIAQLRALEQQQGRVGVSAAQTANAMRMVPAQLTDILVGLQGGQAPLTVFLQQGGQLRDVFGSASGAIRGVAASITSLINPYSLAAAGVGILAYAYNEGSKEADAFNRALIMTGNSVGSSAGQLADYARAISQGIGTQATASEALAALASTGAVSARNMEQFGAATVAAQKYISISVQDMAKDFADLGRAPVASLLKLDESYRFLTSSVYEQVKALQDQGKTEEAAELAQKTYAATFADRANQMRDQLGTIERAWMGAKDSAALAWDMFLGAGRKQTAKQALAKIQEEIKLASQPVPVGGGERGDNAAMRQAAAASKLQELRQQEKEAQYQVDKEEWDNQQAAIAESLRRSSLEWDKVMDGTLSKSERLKLAIKRVTEQGEAAGASDDAIKKAIAKVQQDFAALDNPVLAKLEGNRAVQREVLAGQLQDLESNYKRQLISLGSYTAQKRDLQVRELDLEIGIIKQRAELDKGKEDQSAYQKDEADLRAAMQRRANIISGASNAISEEIYASNKRAWEGADGYAKIMKDYADAQQKTIDAAIKEVEANEKLAQTYGMTRKALAEFEIARLEAQLAQHGAGAFYLDEIENLQKLIDAKKRGAAALGRLDDLDAGKKATEELDRFFDPARAQSLGDALRTAFGSAGDSIAKMTGSLEQFGIKQGEIAKARAAADIEYKASGNYERYLDRLNKLNERNTKEQLGSYGDMAAASASFFGEHSRGYQSLMAMSQVFHAAELAATTAELVPKAISAVLTQGGGDPYTAFGRMAAMGALVAGLGVAIGGIGGGSDTTAKDRQAAQGAGSVFGDSDAKSESIKRALEAVQKNTYQDLAINTGMLVALRSIDNNISSFASQLIGSTDITNPDVGALNTNNGLATTAGTLGLTAGGAAVGSMAGAGLTAFTTLGAVGGPIGMVVGAVAGAILSKIPAVANVMTSIFGGKQSITDSGFGMDAASLASILGSGVHAYQYADIRTSGGWFGSASNDEKTTPLSESANRQFTAIITSLADAVKTSGEMLGLAGDDFTSRLNSFVVDIGHVSLKDLKGEELQKALESVFSKLGDNLAQSTVGGLTQFEKVGEGYLETLTRLAGEYQTIDVVFESFGKTFGAVGLASIGARDRLIEMVGGLDQFTSQGEFFLQNFYSDREQAAALKARIDPTLAQYGLSSAGADADKMFRNFIVGLDTTTEAGAKAYTALMGIAPALKQVIDAGKDVLDERRELQDQLDELIMSPTELLAKKRAALDESNRPLFDQLQPLKERKDLQDQLDSLTMSSTQLLAKQRDALDESNRALFDQVQALKAVKQSATALLGGVDSAYAALQKVVGRERTATQTIIDTHTEVFNRLQSMSQALHSTLDSMKSPEQKLYERAAAQAEIRAALAISKAGGSLSTVQIDSLKKALSAVTQDASSQFSSYTDYMRDLYQTQADVAGLADITDSSLSVEQAILEQAKEQLKSLDNVLTSAQTQIDILKGIDTNGLTLIQAVQGLDLAIAGAKSNPVVAATSAINSAYQSALGRAPDAGGMEYWQNAAANGSSISNIVAAIKGSTEGTLNTLYQSVLHRAPDAAGLQFWAKAFGPTMDEDEKAEWMKAAQAELTGNLHPFAVGTNFIPQDMPAMVHKGERIIPAADNRVLMSVLARASSGDNEALVAEIKALREEVKQLREYSTAENIALINQTKRSADILDGATQGGGPMTVWIEQDRRSPLWVTPV